MSDVRLEIKIRNKDKLLRGIENLTANFYGQDDLHDRPYRMRALCPEALREATIFFYAGLMPEDQALKMVDIFLEKASEAQMSTSLNSLFTGTPTRKSTAYHKMLFNEIARYVEISGYGELIRHVSEPDLPIQDVFALARTMEESKAPSKPYQTAGAKK